MKKFFSLTKKKKRLSGTPDSARDLCGGYELKDKDLGKVHKAAAVGDLVKLKELAEKHDINQLDKENRTALHIACATGQVEVVQFLLERKAKLNLCDNQNRSALMKAVQCQQESCVRILLENHADPNLVDIDDNTALHLAANVPSISTAVLLLEHDADIGAQNKEGFTPFAVAVCNDHIEMTEFLLKEGADIDVVDRDQRSPLMITAGNGQIAMLRLLLRFNADVTLKDTKGWSADDYAVMNGHHPCSLLINEHGTKRNNGQSTSPQGLSKEKNKTLLDSLSKDGCAAVNLGGPATSKSDNEDSSTSDTQSRDFASDDEWPSSEDDSLSIEKKPQAVNLMKLFASKRAEVSVLSDRSLRDTKSETESENNVQRIPFSPKDFPSSKVPQHPVDPCPNFLLSKEPQMTSCSPPNSKQSSSENLNMPHDDTQVREELSSGEEEIKEHTFYVPSFLRGEGGNKMTMLEPWWNVGRSSQGKGDYRNQHDDIDEMTQEGFGKPTLGLPSVLSKLECGKDRKKDLMEELGLVGVDDLEYESDWDSDGTSSKRSLPEDRVASPELPKCSPETFKEQGEDDIPTSPVTPQRSITSNRSPQTAPFPQPSASTRMLHKQKCAEGETGSPELSSAARDSHISAESGKQQEKVGKQTTEAAVLMQNCSTSWDSAAPTPEELTTAKSETPLGCLSNQAKQHPTATTREPVQFHCQHNQTISRKQEERHTAQEVEVVSRAPQPRTHINEDHFSLYDDSSLSDVPDIEGRLSASGKEKKKNPEDVEMAEDLGDLTQSSDSSTDDVDSPVSGYNHTSLFIEKLNSTLDSKTIVELQDMIYKFKRSIQKERYRSANLADKVSHLEIEKVQLRRSLEEIKDHRSGLELNQVELENEVRNLKFRLKQEQEDHCNATREKLRAMEEQKQLDLQEKEKVEFTLRNVELENRKLVNNLKQLEEDYSKTQSLLTEERSARMGLEKQMNSCLLKQQEIEEENTMNISKSSEALSQLTDASNKEKEMQQQITTLQEQLTNMRRELEHSRDQSGLRESTLLKENKALKEQLEDARQDLKKSQISNNEALTSTVSSCNNQVTTLKSELAERATHLEIERHTRETLEAELKSTHTRLAGAEKEAKLSRTAHSERERALLREKEENQHLKDKLTGEIAVLREANNSLSQNLIKAEAHANRMENEVHRVTQQLTEKGLLLEVLQREKDQAVAHGLELEKTLHAEKEQLSRDRVRHEATQERLTQAQSELMLLRQQLEEAQNKGLAKERAVTDAQEHLKDILSKLQSDYEERVQLVKERNKDLDTKAVDLQDHIYNLQEEKNEMKTSLRQVQQELADSLKKLSMSEASLEVNTRYRNDLEEEKARLFKDLDRLKGKLEESKEQYVEGERRIASLKGIVDEKERELSTAAQKLQEALSTMASKDTTIKQLEEDVQKLEIENARLEATASKQSKEIDVLQKGTQEAAMVRGHLEDLVANLQSKMSLEDQFNKEAQKQSMLSHTAQETQALWQQELRSRTKLGLRLAELEKEKGELSTQMEVQKKKTIQLAEQKKAVDSRLDQELIRNAELQKEMYRLRTLVKTAKKKLRDQERGGTEFGSPGRMKDTVDSIQIQLEKEVSLRSQLEKVNEDLKDQLASMKGLPHSRDQMDRGRKLEEEVLELKRQIEAFQQNQVEQHRHHAEEWARQELQRKLEQVNRFLQSEAASHEALEQSKAAREANLRFQFEQRMREMEEELSRTRASHHSTRTELERYQQLYTQEMQRYKSLADKLEWTNYQVRQSSAMLLNEHKRSTGTNILHLNSLGSTLKAGATKGKPNRNPAVEHPLLNAGMESTTAEDFIAKLQSEFERNISEEIKTATAELERTTARLSPVGSISRAELDPVSIATQQYLEVLKKNSMF